MIASDSTTGGASLPKAGPAASSTRRGSDQMRCANRSESGMPAKADRPVLDDTARWLWGWPPPWQHCDNAWIPMPDTRGRSWWCVSMTCCERWG